MSRSLGTGLLIVLLTTLAVRADDIQPGAADGELTGQQQALLDQLGDVSFDVRESAARKLQGQGLAARPVLLAGMRHVDLEIRMRARQLLSRIVRADFERRLTAFINDEKDAGEHAMPAWKQFRQAVGGDRGSRKLYAEMLRHESGLLHSLEADPTQAESQFSKRVRSLQSRTFTPFYQKQTMHPASLATLLFVGSAVKRPDSNASSLMYSLLNQTPMKNAVMQGTHSRLMKKLLERWIVIRTNSSQAYYGLLLALNYNLDSTGLKLGRQYLTQRTTSSTVIQYAAIAVGRFGDKSDVPLLEKQLKNTTVCHTWSNRQLKKNGLIKIQIRDICLVMLLRVTKQDPRKYGFNLLQANPTTLYHIYTFGFVEDKQRDTAFKKYTEWKEKQGKPEKPEK